MYMLNCIICYCSFVLFITKKYHGFNKRGTWDVLEILMKMFITMSASAYIALMDVGNGKSHDLIM